MPPLTLAGRVFDFAERHRLWAAGTPVIAAAGGRIEKLFRSDDGGNTVYVRSPDGRTLYYYAHLQAYASGLEEGEQVEPGHRLGTVGSSASL